MPKQCIQVLFACCVYIYICIYLCVCLCTCVQLIYFVYVQDHLGDVVFVEIPEVGVSVTQGNSFGAVESVKATSDVNSPVSGKVMEVNEELGGSPGLVSHLRNMYKIRLTYCVIFLFRLE